MTTKKKIAAILLTTAGIIAVLCNILGIGGVWFAVSTINSTMTSALTAVEQGVQRSNQLLGNVDSSLAQLQTSVNDIESRVNQLGTNISENQVILDALKQEYDGRATPLMRQTVETLRSARTALDKATATAEALNSNPLIALVTPDFERLQALDATVDQMQADLVQLGLQLRELKVDATQAVTGAITANLDRVDSALQRARDATTALEQRATDLASRATELKNSVLFWINLAAVVISLLLLAAVVAGVGLTWMSISYLRSGGKRVDTLLGSFGASGLSG